MTTFVDPDLLNTAPLDPVSSELMTAMKLNPVAMGEGADGAQRIEPTATTRFAIPVGTLASPSVLIVPTGSLDAGMYFVYMSINAGGTGGDIEYRTTSDGGNNWTGWNTILTVVGDTEETHDVSGTGVAFPAGTNGISMRYDGSGVKSAAGVFMVWGA